MHRVHVVADRLDRERLALRSHVALDVFRPNPIQRLAAEERRDVVSEVRRDSQSVRLAPAFQLEALAELASRLLDRHSPAVWRRPRRVDLAHPPQHALGLRWTSPALVDT